MTVLEESPVIASESVKSHADKKKGLTPHFLQSFRHDFVSEVGTWEIDSLAERAPWRAGAKPHDRITFARLAVHRAWQAASISLSRERGDFEAGCVLRHGYLENEPDPIRELRLAAIKAAEQLSPMATAAWISAESRARRLGWSPPPPIAQDGTCAELAAWFEQIDDQALGRGRPSTVDLNAFFESLVEFWDRNMSRPAPSSRRPDAKYRRGVGFHEFAAAAAKAAGWSFTTPPDRAITRAVISRRRQENRGV